MSDEALRDLARRAGIEVEWQDYAGHPRVVAPDVLRAILAAVGLPAETRSQAASSRRLVARHTALEDLPPLVTATAGRPTRLDLGAGDPQTAKLQLERGGSRDITLMPARGRLRVPAITETHRCGAEGKRTCRFNGTLQLTGFRGHSLHPGAKITVSITRPEWIGKYYVFKIRAGRGPKVQIGCLAPGAQLPGGAC